MIEVKNLTKKYGSFTAVKNLSFTIEKGHIYGLLGPNGAGKSTTMNIMTGCLAATEGTVTVNGHDIYEEAKSAKKNIGYLPEIPPLYMDMTPVEYLKFVGRAKGLRSESLRGAIEDAMEKTGLISVADRLIKNLSKGYKQRVGIAQAILGDPEIIILDEPTVGLDPTQLVEIRGLIRSLKEDHAVILSSHIMGEITAVCDYVIIIANGRILKQGTLEELEGSTSGTTLTVESRGTKAEVQKALNSVPGIKYCNLYETGTGVKAIIEPQKGQDVREAVFNAYVAINAPILSMTTAGISLEDLFIKLLSETPDDVDGTEGRPARRKKIYTPSPLGKAYLDEDKSEPAEDGACKDGGADTSENSSESECDGDSNEYKPLFSDSEGGDE